jgi:octaprenyl-diphosphate synthase
LPSRIPFSQPKFAFQERRVSTQLPPEVAQVQDAITSALARVNERFDRQLRSEFLPVQRLCRHVERYRGKMLRPMLVLASGLAAGKGGGVASDGCAVRGDYTSLITPDHITVAAVCEMIHMATLVHDDVLDEADTRRRGETINRLHGNETAVILGDYLIAAAYHLCSQLDSQKIALMLGQASMTLCTGELLQLSHREDLSLDEPTYFEIVERKTASLVALACHLGAACSGTEEATCQRFESFGLKIGVAFQIQDDLLDLTSRQATLGKPVGKDLEKGKLTLPMIHYLSSASPIDRGRALTLLEEACNDSASAQPARAQLLATMEQSGSLRHAQAVAAALVNEAKGQLAFVPDSAPRALMLAMADAVITRSF